MPLLRRAPPGALSGGVARLRAAGVKVFTMVGGAVVTPEYAAAIGADLYAADALEAVARVKELFRQKTA